jgi:DNA-directed RNA polymerase specialized sigma24 family protein
MSSPKILAPQWVLTEEAFDQFLRCLHPDREQAGLAYEALRLKLNYFFESRRCVPPETLTDETINRLIRKISEGEEIINLDRYAFTVAKYVYLESQRGVLTDSLENCLPENDLNAARQVEILRREMEEDLLRSECMKKCLAKLPPAIQELLIEYYQGTGREQTANRQQMATARGITANALYIQVHRVREKLEECLANCLKKA